MASIQNLARYGLAIFLLGACTFSVEVRSEVDMEDLAGALSADDACAASSLQGDCGLNMLQRRADAAASAAQKVNEGIAIEAIAQKHEQKVEEVSKVAKSEAASMQMQNKTDMNSTAAKKRGACTAADAAAIAAKGGGTSDGSFPGAAASCGKGSYNLFWGFNIDSFSSCLMGQVQVTKSCADCFGEAGKYSADNCKMQCMWGSWCSSSCLDCSNQHKSSLDQCVGAEIALPAAQSC